jgi:ketosteroid isomerase-like protein
MGELAHVVDELVVTQQRALAAIAKWAADEWLLEVGESTHQRRDSLERLARELAPLVLTPEQLRQASDPDERDDVDAVGLPV